MLSSLQALDLNRIVSSPLNPLRYCHASTVRHFAESASLLQVIVFLVKTSTFTIGNEEIKLMSVIFKGGFLPYNYHPKPASMSAGIIIRCPCVGNRVSFRKVSTTKIESVCDRPVDPQIRGETRKPAEL